MSFRVEPGSFALLAFPEPPDAADLAALAPPAQMVCEAGETSLLVAEDRLQEILTRHPRARVERDYSWIRFEAPMGWEVVGFLARVTGALAAAGIPLGAVCGFSRDHLFVARRHLPAARTNLRQLFPEVDATIARHAD